MTHKINQVDNLIQHLKSSKPYDEAGTFKLWEALKILSDELVEVHHILRDNLEDTIVEIPEGLINGSNKKYYLSQKPVNDFILGFKSGLLLFKDTDFVVKDQLVTFTVAPAGGSTLQFVYQVRRTL